MKLFEKLPFGLILSLIWSIGMTANGVMSLVNGEVHGLEIYEVIWCLLAPWYPTVFYKWKQPIGVSLLKIIFSFLLFMLVFIIPALFFEINMHSQFTVMRTICPKGYLGGFDV